MLEFMTAHFDCNCEIETEEIKQKIKLSTWKISIFKVVKVKKNFHARFDAVSEHTKPTT